MGRALPEYQSLHPLVSCFCLPRRMECKGVYQVKRSNHQYASCKHAHTLASRAKRQLEMCSGCICSICPSGWAKRCHAQHLWQASSISPLVECSALLLEANVSLNHVRVCPPPGFPLSLLSLLSKQNNQRNGCPCSCGRREKAP